MSLKKSLFSALLTLCFSLSLNAQQALSLSDAIMKGLENNYRIEISELQRDIAANNNDWAIAGRYPTINLTANSNNNYRNSSNPGSVLRESNTFNVGITPGIQANWVLFDGYRVNITKKQLEGQQQLSEGNIKVAVENTMQSVHSGILQCPDSTGTTGSAGRSITAFSRPGSVSGTTQRVWPVQHI